MGLGRRLNSMAYWLFKTEPDEFSIDDLNASPNQTARWDGIRNFQARNFIRDQIALTDQVLIYHSQCRPTAIVGRAEVVKAAYPDPAQFDPQSPYFDTRASKDAPRWFCVDIRLIERFAHHLTLTQIKSSPPLAEMALLKQGRLSVSPVRATEAALILSHCQEADPPQ